MSGVLYAGIKETTNTNKRASMFLRAHCGEASLAGKKWEMATSLSTGEPIIRSEQTGRHFVLTWQEILDMAIAAGIDDLKKPAKFAGEP